ncbi:hypothetical protein M5X11_13775 [Paenibacillus alginolyticus]|uniref:YkoP family protein n=1 Tax=Paenibacillus alginolyticus TaxID=59839 RepID=UPI00068839B6|nr:hypothetical protein [Paenibacillus alginolyticus]MCY9666020.1 hypothetical protein [Paenibacillus alginolyticus]
MTAALMKTSLQSLWIMWEHVFDFLNRFRSESVWRYGIYKLVVRQHRGKRITCQDGRRILAGDWVGELHLDNRQVMLVISKQSLKERFTVRKKDSKPSPLDGYQDMQSQGKKEAVS